MRHSGFWRLLIWLVASSTFAENQRWLQKPEELANWADVFEKTSRLSTSTGAERERVERELVSLGVPAVHPLVVIAIRDYPQSSEVRSLLRKFEIDSLVSEIVELRLSQASRITCDVVASFGAPAVEKVRLLIERNPLGEAGRFAKCVALASGPKVVPTLIDIVNTSENQLARGVAMGALAQIDDPRAKDALVRGVGARSGVRQAAARGLIRFPDQRAGPDLLNMMEDEKLGIARESALGALAGIYQPHMRSRVAMVAWRDPGGLIRRGAANVLSGSQDRIAQRLGARYYESYYESVDFLAYYYWAGRFGVTAVALCFIAAAGSRSHLKKSLLFATLVGIYWGFFATDVWLRQELRLLGLFVPVALALAWKFGLNDDMLMNVGLGWLGLTFVLRFSMMLVPIMGLAGIAPAGYGPTVLLLALPFLAHRFRTREAEQLARERASVVRTAATFYLSYAASFAALWGHLGF